MGNDLVFPDTPSPPVAPWKRVATGSRVDYPGLTTDSLAAHKAAWKEYEQAFAQWRQRCAEIAVKAAEALTERGFPKRVRVWTRHGDKSRRGGRLERSLHDVLHDFAPAAEVKTLWTHTEEEWLRLSWSRERAEKAESEAKGLRDRAVAWLLARGKKYGDDFTADDAPAVALHIAAAEKIAALRKAEPWHEFNGHNCNDWGDREKPCKGWDGESRRCQCGNRRVSWEIEGTFEDPHTYGEAY